jgi:hypothetical protein
MSSRWLYDTNGRTKYYQQGQHLYDAATNQYALYQDGKYFYEIVGNKSVYYTTDEERWLYTMDGKATLYYG